MRTAKTVWLRWAQSVLSNKHHEAPQFSPSRRQFLQNTSKSAIAFAFLPNNIDLTDVKNPRIAVIGGGLAGMTCAWQLKKAGLKNVKVYEASNHVGGRTYTLDEFQKGGTACEIGGEFFHSGHRHMISIARELKLKIFTASSPNSHLKPFTVFFGNKEIPLEELEQSLLDFSDKMIIDIADLPDSIAWETSDKFRHLDEMSVTEYLLNKGVDKLGFEFLSKAMTIEFGMEANEQSAMNLLQAFKKGFAFHPSSKIKSLQIKGGNQSICKELKTRMWDSVLTDYKLINLHQHTTWYKMEFQHAGRIKKVEADYVVLAVPFSVFRNIKCDIHFPERKQLAINELGHGKKGKLLLGFDQKPWRNQGYDGLTFSDEMFGYGSDLSPKHKGKNNVLSVKPCGNEAEAFAKMDAADAALKSLHSFNKIYPGITNDFSGEALKFSWSDNPNFMGSNSCYKAGQLTQFGGEEGKSVENLFFAGEHCSHDHKGTMNGAVETGYLTANNIIRRVKRSKRKSKP